MAERFSEHCVNDFLSRVAVQSKAAVEPLWSLARPDP